MIKFRAGDLPVDGWAINAENVQIPCRPLLNGWAVEWSNSRPVAAISGDKINCTLVPTCCL